MIRVRKEFEGFAVNEWMLRGRCFSMLKRRCFGASTNELKVRVETAAKLRSGDLQQMEQMVDNQ